MLIDTRRVVAVRCPQCGRLELRDYSLFELHSSKPTTIRCQCGHFLVEIGRHSRLYKLHIGCIICETQHEILVDAKGLIHNDALVLFCPVSDIDLAMIGRAERVQELLAAEGDLLANVVVPGAIDSAFVDIEIMREVLGRLQTWANDGQLYCGCGNRQLELDLFSEKVEVVCSECGGTLVIYAEREEDLAAMEGLQEVVLKKGAFTCIDSADFRYRHRV
ncbi:MAG: hypothetical protein GX047_04475 [Firmicutes bacterium]|jgi:hypothetical protein|nr:hypothetical protein [Bacillota bacterium]